MNMLEVEGFGHEVLSFGTLFTLLMIFIAYYLYKHWPTFSVDLSPWGLVIRVLHYVVNRPPSADQNAHPSGSVNSANGEPQRRLVVYNEEDSNCPVCLNPFRHATLANCGHVYCAQCIVAYWRHGTWLDAVACPVCRTKVTVLMPNFTEPNVDDADRNEALADIRSYNRRFSNEPRSWLEHIRDIPVLVPNLFRELFSIGGLMLMFRLRVMILTVAAGMYILSPLDILPEAILGVFGLLDDLFIMFLLLVYLCIAYRQFLSRQ